MPEKSSDGDNWLVSYSDDENGEPKSKTNWEPPPAEFLRLYETLDTNGSVPVGWNWPHGRHAPSDPRDEMEEGDEEAMETKPEEKSDFDFMDEATTPILRQGRTSGPKGSAKKKTTSFSSILSNIKRHQQQQRLEKEEGTRHKRH